jgi:hypothetical protein
MEEGGG